jgi:hypothetical protein
MLLKNNLKKLKKVGISVWGKNGQKFINNKGSITMTVYDATPDEVLRLIVKALSQE